MKKTALSILPCAVCGLLLAIPAAAADRAPAAKAVTTKASPAHKAWPAENLSGKIITVKPAQKLVVVKGSDGVPFDMLITPKTRITHGGQAVSLKDLGQFQNASVSLRFIPERRGDVAEWMRIGG